MSVKIRNLELSDLENASNLFGPEIDVTELRWLFSFPQSISKMNAFGAVDEQGELLGIIGYLPHQYVVDRKLISAIVPISWMLKKDYKGMAGVLLFKRVFENSELGIAIAGTEAAVKLYPLFKFEYLSSAKKFHKIISLKHVYFSLKRKNIFKTLGMISILLPSLFRKCSHELLDTDLKLVEYTGNNYSNELVFDHIQNKFASKEFVDWLLDCPKVASKGFLIKHKGLDYGVCVFHYKNKGMVRAGRISHLPYLGEDSKVWNAVIKISLDILKDLGCSVVSVVGSHKAYVDSLVMNGFMNLNRYELPVFLRAKHQIRKDFEMQNWMFQFSDGDNFYRDL